MKSFLLAFTCGISCASVLHAQATPARPNVIVILVSGLGYGDVGFNGCPDFPTPNIDSLTFNGVRCSNGYSTAPVTGPSQAGLMTGRYQQRFGYENQIASTSDANPRAGLPMSELLLPQILKPAGYVSGAIGKWRLGGTPNLLPLQRGFDEFFGVNGAYTTYFNAKVYRGNTIVPEPEYLTDAFTREGVSFINRHAAESFLLYLAYNAPQDSPFTAPQSYLNRVANITDPTRQRYAAMVTALDDGVGKVLQALQANNLLDNTLIFFLSDHGGENSSAVRNDPLRGGKGTLTEGGIRVPFVMQWSGHLPAQGVYEEPISSLDIVATAAAVASVTLPSDRVYDGLNMIPYLTRQQVSPQRTLFWREFGLGPSGPGGATAPTTYAVRSGPLKLLSWGGGSYPLYNVSSDISETQDLNLSRRSDVASLKDLYAQWDNELIAPLWRHNAGQPGNVVLAGDWNAFNKADSAAPWNLTRVTAPGAQGTPDGLDWSVNTIHVAATGGDTTAGTHSFTFVRGNNYSAQWGGATINIDGTTSVPYFSGSALGPANNISLEEGFYYSFRLLSWRSNASLKAAVMKTSAPPVSVRVSGQTPMTPTSDDPVVVGIVTSQAKSAEERIYLRWSTDTFITSHMVEAAGSGVDYNATIPAQPAGTAVQYCLATSTVDLSPVVASGAIDPLILATSVNSKFVVGSGAAATPTPTPSATPAITPTPSPTASPTPSPSASPSPTDTPTPTPSPSASPSPTDTPTPTPSPTPSSADLKVTVTDFKTSVAAGAQNTYTITVTNAGPATVTGAKVTDTFPSAFIGVTYTSTQTGSAAGFTASGTGNINDTVNMPSASKITYTAKGKVSTAATGTIANTAEVTAPSGATDPNTANNSATDSDTTIFEADLKVTVTDGKTAAVAGTKNTYTITVTNAGPSNVAGAVIQDAFPSTFTGVTYTATQTGGATGFTASGTGNINNTVNMPAAAKITYKATGTISASAGGSISNTATVTSPSSVPDPRTANNTATDTDTM